MCKPLPKFSPTPVQCPHTGNIALQQFGTKILKLASLRGHVSPHSDSD
jgi:hypothetical protein